jgi:hypothetical protein
MRFFLKGRAYTQSLKTTNMQAAISEAKQFFYNKTAELYADRVEARSDRKTKFFDLIPGVVVGKWEVEVGAEKDLVPTLELLKGAVLAGELGAQIDAASGKLREGFKG